MSYEYLASFESDVNFSLLDILQQPDVKELAVVLSFSENNVSLRWSDSKGRDKWPEDITITRDGDGLYVMFHIGNKRQFLLFLEKLSTALSVLLRSSIEFTEI